MKKLENRSDIGILHAEAGRRQFTLHRYSPSEDLAPYVEHYWYTAWDLRGHSPYRQVVLTHPCINLVFEKDDHGCFTGIHGIRESIDFKLLKGKGMALGVKFKPGGFYPFWRQPLNRLTGLSIRCDELLGIDMMPIEQHLFDQDNGEEMAAAAEAFLRELRPRPDASAELATRIVEATSRNRSLAKAGDLAEEFGISLRSLQRLFSQYVGISPKWVIRRCRLHEAAERMEKGDLTEWTELAAHLGYYDQAHFIRDFKRIIGQSPETYLRDIR